MPDPILEPNILKTISKNLGIQVEEDYFDPEVVVFINRALQRLCELGVGPKTPFRIVDGTETWSDFMSTDSSKFEGVKTFIYLYTRLLFDPPSSGFVTNSIEAEINKLEWLLMVDAENERIDIFQPGMIYNVGDTVIKDGVHYVRITPQEVPEKWNFRNWKVYDYQDDSVADYDSTRNYKVGEKCKYNTKYYVCVINSPAGDFNADNWVEYNP